jgi:hypothetical protein
MSQSYQSAEDGSGPKPFADDPVHTEGGAPTDQAHRDVGDGTLTGSMPAGLTPAEMAEVADKDPSVDPGTG